MLGAKSFRNFSERHCAGIHISSQLLFLSPPAVPFTFLRIRGLAASAFHARLRLEFDQVGIYRMLTRTTAHLAARHRTRFHYGERRRQMGRVTDERVDESETERKETATPPT